MVSILPSFIGNRAMCLYITAFHRNVFLHWAAKNVLLVQKNIKLSSSQLHFMILNTYFHIYSWKGRTDMRFLILLIYVFIIVCFLHRSLTLNGRKKQKLEQFVTLCSQFNFILSSQHWRILPTAIKRLSNPAICTDSAPNAGVQFLLRCLTWNGKSHRRTCGRLVPIWRGSWGLSNGSIYL